MVTPWNASVGFEGPAPEDGWPADINIALVCDARWTDTHGASMDDSESYSVTRMWKHSSKTPRFTKCPAKVFVLVSFSMFFLQETHQFAK